VSEQNLVKIDGSPALTPRDEIAAHLGRLRLHYPMREMSQEHVRLVMEDYLDDLEQFRPELIEMALRHYRRTPGTKWFPSVGEIMACLRPLTTRVHGDGRGGHPPRVPLSKSFDRRIAEVLPKIAKPG